MLRFKGTVEYTDGTSAEFECGTAAVASWERYAVRHKIPYGDESPGTLSNLVIAHHALAIAEGIDAWIETVEGVEVVVLKDGVPIKPGEAGAVPPTGKEASTGSP